MATTRPAFKDYEYGLYGHLCSQFGIFMNNGTCQTVSLTQKGNTLWKNYYSERVNSMLRQMSKLKGVVFIYGDYKDCI
jgi:hypothetical protein